MNLVQNELIKVFKRSHFYIMLLLILLVILLYNVIEAFLIENVNIQEQYKKAYKNDSLLLENYDNFNVSESYKDIFERVQLEKFAVDQNIKYNIFLTSENNNISIPTDARNMFLKFFDNFEILVIFVIIYLSYTSILEEYTTGTIKRLLIKPFNRSTILFSKILSIVFSIFIIIFIMLFFQYLFGGMLFGFDSYNLEAIRYNFSTNSIESTPLLLYIVSFIIMKVPMFLLLISISFLISLFSMNIVFNTLFSLGIYVISTMHILINNITKYLFIFNWDISLFWFQTGYNNIHLIISSISLIIILVFIFILFNNKDIMNT